MYRTLRFKSIAVVKKRRFFTDGRRKKKKMGNERKIIKRFLSLWCCVVHIQCCAFRIAVGSPFTMAICLHLTTVKRKLLSYKFSGLFFFFNRITRHNKSLNRIITIMYTAQYKAPAAASKYLCQYKRGGRQNGCSVCVFIYRPFLLLLIFCLRQYHSVSVCIRLRKEKSVCILSSNVMSMAVEDLNLATLFTSFSLSGSEAKFREGLGSRSSSSRSSSGGSCVVILMAVGSARRHTFGFSC